MSCEHCVRRISSAVKAVANVENVTIDLAGKTVEVTGSAPSADVIKAIEGAGYTVEQDT
jgi:Cu2+-exporting ATPase